MLKKTAHFKAYFLEKIEQNLQHFVKCSIWVNLLLLFFGKFSLHLAYFFIFEDFAFLTTCGRIWPFKIFGAWQHCGQSTILHQSNEVHLHRISGFGTKGNTSNNSFYDLLTSSNFFQYQSHVDSCAFCMAFYFRSNCTESCHLFQ